MIFIALTFFAAFLIEGLGTLVSVIGLSTLFGSNPIIIALAIALDIGKIVVVSLLYTYWRQLNRLMKTYALLAATVTMIITSAGAAGYLSGEFQKAIIGTQETSLKVDVLKQEQAKLEERKKQIDAGIAAIPDRYSANQKIRLINQFKDEQKQVTARLNEISKELPTLQVAQIGVEAKAGPILYIAKAFNVTVEEAVKWVILMIIFVFDPLAIFLIISANFLLHQRRINKTSSVADADLFEEKVEPPMPQPPTFSTKEAAFLDDEPGVGANRVSFDEQMAALRSIKQEPKPVDASLQPAPAWELPSAVDAQHLKPREEITKSKLAGVRPDNSTRIITMPSDDGRVGDSDVKKTGY